MTKRDWIWVAVRVFGIYLMVLAITAIPYAITTGIQWWVNHDAGTKADSMYGMLNKVTNSQLAEFAGAIVRVIVLGLAGVYFLKGARAVSRLIAPPDCDRDGRLSSPATNEPPR